ncbi:MAG: Fic family protein [Candidatus Altiarchaeota archaeon]|nr:Fic family protein [Candidatus Altiarchaeota archaeon]
MHLEIRTIGKSKKYYLAHSFREGSRVRKIRRFLGTNLTDSQVSKLRTKAEEIIRQEVSRYRIISNPLSREPTVEELRIIRKLQEKVTVRINHLSKDDWRTFTEAFTYDTNAIEGSTVSYTEVKGILEKDTWPKERKKWEISETYGVAKAVGEIRTTPEHLSLELIKRLHLICFANSKEFAGKFRPRGVEVCIKNNLGEVLHVGAPAHRVRSLLAELVSWYEKNRRIYPPLLLAAVVHNQFETVHPFQDGNGRIGRLLLNNILIKHGMPPVNITFGRRGLYYRAIRDYQNKGDVRPMVELILSEYKRFYRMGDYKDK